MGEAVLVVKSLKRSFALQHNDKIEAVNDISFTVNKGEFFGLVGESGSGKSTVGACVIGLQKPQAGNVTFFGRCMQMVFQDAVSALNPRMTIGQTVAEPLYINRVGSHSSRLDKVISLLELVGLNASFLERYPADLSGGQQQRIGIARALALEPDLLIADESIASLDVSIQAQMVNLFARLKREKGMACLFISHDLAMVRHISDRIGVMHKGCLVECAQTKQLFDSPLHPYTKALIQSIPVPDPAFYSDDH